MITVRRCGDIESRFGEILSVASYVLDGDAVLARVVSPRRPVDLSRRR